MANNDNLKIDLGAGRKGMINESWLAMFGGWLEWLIKGLGVGNASITGKRAEIESFLDAVSGEKKYIDTVSRYGLKDPKTFNTHSSLMNAIGEFERETGIKWPIK